MGSENYASGPETPDTFGKLNENAAPADASPLNSFPPIGNAFKSVRIPSGPAQEIFPFLTAAKDSFLLVSLEIEYRGSNYL